MKLNATTGGPYTYSQSAHHFYGVAFDGSYIDTYNSCAGANDECRNNPDCQCTKNEGPLPQGGLNSSLFDHPICILELMILYMYMLS